MKYKSLASRWRHWWVWDVAPNEDDTCGSGGSACGIEDAFVRIDGYTEQTYKVTCPRCKKIMKEKSNGK